MKFIKLFTIAACTVALLVATAFAEQAPCCKKAADAGTACTHKCCIAAAKEGKECEKCGGSGEIAKKDPKKEEPKKPEAAK
jgi:hypothetical protein